MNDWHVPEAVWTYLVLLGAALSGRLMYVARQVQAGTRQLFSMATAMDLLIAFAMGVIAHGLCSWAGITGAVEAGIIAVAGYLGPYSIDELFARALKRVDAAFNNRTDPGA